MSFYCIAYAQSTCEDNCGSGTLEEYLNGEVDCVCSLDCAGYGSACCDYYDVCYENPTNLNFEDFIGIWNGNITNDQTWSYDDSISIEIQENGQYLVTHNPGGHLISDSYPGTEDVYYDSSTNLLTFRWVTSYHYSCGGACYASVPFQVMEYNNGAITLFYNNGSGPAPQANSLYLSSPNWEPPSDPYDLNEDGNVTLVDSLFLLLNIINDVETANADFNFDSIVNIFDLIIMVDYISNL